MFTTGLSHCDLHLATNPPAFGVVVVVVVIKCPGLALSVNGGVVVTVVGNFEIVPPCSQLQLWPSQPLLVALFKVMLITSFLPPLTKLCCKCELEFGVLYF